MNDTVNVNGMQIGDFRVHIVLMSMMRNISHSYMTMSKVGERRHALSPLENLTKRASLCNFFKHS
jgi:hypothetical protein